MAELEPKPKAQEGTGAENLQSENVSAGSTSSAPAPPQSKLAKIANEIRDSEKRYVEALKLLWESHIEPVVHDDELLPAQTRSSLARTLPELRREHEAFLVKLNGVLPENSSDSEDVLREIGELFVNFAPSLGQYVAFMVAYGPLQADLVRLLEQNEAFAEHAANATATLRRERNERRDLLSLLAGPLQRVPRYALLLRELLRETPDNAQYRAARDSLQRALDAVGAALQDINDRTVAAGDESAQGDGVVRGLFNALRGANQWFSSVLQTHSSVKTVRATAAGVPFTELDKLAAQALLWRAGNKEDDAKKSSVAFWCNKGMLERLRKIRERSPLCSVGNVGKAGTDLAAVLKEVFSTADDDAHNEAGASKLDGSLGALLVVLEQWLIDARDELAERAAQKSSASKIGSSSSSSSSAAQPMVESTIDAALVKSAEALLAAIAERVASGEFFALLLAKDEWRASLVDGSWGGAPMPVRLVVTGIGRASVLSAVGYSEHVSVQLGDGLLHLIYAEDPTVALVVRSSLSSQHFVAIYDVTDSGLVTVTRDKLLKLGALAYEKTRICYSRRLNNCQDFALAVLDVLLSGAVSKRASEKIPRAFASAVWAAMPQSYVLLSGGQRQKFTRFVFDASQSDLQDYFRRFDQACQNNLSAMSEMEKLWNKAQVRAMQENFVNRNVKIASKCFGKEECTKI